MFRKEYKLKIAYITFGILFLFSGLFYTLSFSYEDSLRVPFIDRGRLVRTLLNQLGMRYMVPRWAPDDYKHLAKIQTPDFLRRETIEGLPYDIPWLEKTKEGYVLIKDSWGVYRVLQAPFKTLENYLILEKACVTCSALLLYARRGTEYVLGSIHIPPDGPGRYEEVTSYYRDVKDWVIGYAERGFTDIRVLFLNPKGLSKPMPFTSNDVHYKIEHMIYDLNARSDIVFVPLPLHILPSGQVGKGYSSPVYTDLMSNINGVFIVTVEVRKGISGVIETPVPRVLLWNDLLEIANSNTVEIEEFLRTNLETSRNL